MRSTFFSIVSGAIFLVLMIATASTEARAGQAVEAGRSYSPASSDSSTPEPEGGMVKDTSYSNQYFDLSYPLPPDWRQDFKGPLPSNTGYYVLAAVRPKGQLNATVLLTAQDLFFATRPVNSALDFLEQRQRQAVQSTLTIDKPARNINTAGHSFARLDFSGAGLLHAIFATDIRCHVVTFEITTRDPQVLDSLSQEMLQLSLPPAADAGAGGGEFPVCIKDYAESGNLIHKVDPADVGARFTRVPARIIIDKQGRVKHVHVLNAFPDQARSVEDALLQWTFKPYLRNGQPAEVETGILFEFGTPNKSGAVMITPGSRNHLSATKELQ
jgi:hypothetical protein